MSIFDALYDHDSTIRTLLVRDERLAGVMAESYGRVTGRPAAILAQAAWVVANAATGILEALTGSSPMVILADVSDKIPWSHQNPTQSGTGEPGNWDARLSLRGLTKQVVDVHHPAQAVAQTQLALKHAVSGTPGPAAVLFYASSLAGTVGPDTRPSLYQSSAYLHPDERGAAPELAAAAAAALAAAAKPVIVAGNGVRVAQARHELRMLAEQLGAPVVTTSSGKGVFPEVHSLGAGVVGDYGLAAAMSILGDADVVLAVGTRLAPGDTLHQHASMLDGGRQTLIQIDVDPTRVGWAYPVDVPLVGHARTVLRQLHAALGSVAPRPGAELVQKAFDRFGGFDVAESSADDVPVLPQRLIKVLNDCLPADAVVTADAGENRIFLVHHLRTSDGDFLQPGSMGGMGYSIPAALGAKLADPSRPVVAMVGDGGFAMSINGLMTSLEAALPIVVVVMNNSMLGWVRHMQGERPIASTLPSYDHAALARSLGCDGVRVEKPSGLEHALRDALRSGRTTVIDVRISAEQSWERVTSPLAQLSRSRER